MIISSVRGKYKYTRLCHHRQISKCLSSVTLDRFDTIEMYKAHRGAKFAHYENPQRAYGIQYSGISAYSAVKKVDLREQYVL